MAKILLVEDDKGILESLIFSFRQSENELIVAQSIKEAKEILSREILSLVLLDVTLGDGNGFDFFKEYLLDKKYPTIFLTAMDEENDIVKGFELGAEDYITKPFSVRELMARVKRTLARQKTSRIIKIKNITYDLDNMQLSKDGEIINLSGLELKILHLIMENNNKVVSRESIIDLIWDVTGNDVYDHTVTVYIKRIRTKLGVDIFKTVKGVGYRLAREDEI